MRYLTRFQLPGQDREDAFLEAQRRTCYSTKYPFHIFRYRNVPPLTFEPITIFYGGNGSGKSTLLNVMADALGLHRRAVYNRSPFFSDYVSLCQWEVSRPEGVQNGRIITSDDVFDYVLNLRCLNEGLDTQREALLSEYRDVKYAKFQLRSLDDYDKLSRSVDAIRKTGSAYARDRLMEAPQEQSNGESALQFFTEAMADDALCLLDEPENSLSAQGQLKLRQHLLDAVRFFGCQLIISTHSPFLLSIPGAKIYDLDADPPVPRRWTDLENVRLYRQFFQEHEGEFV